MPPIAPQYLLIGVSEPFYQLIVTAPFIACHRTLSHCVLRPRGLLAPAPLSDHLRDTTRLGGGA